MAHIVTSNGLYEYKSHLLYFGGKKLNAAIMLENLKLFSSFIDKIDLNWGPAFGTLIGIVRNDDFQPWKPVFDIYILKEDEERFRDLLWHLRDEGFELARYERRGLYYLQRKGEFLKIYVLHKIGTDVRHTGSTDFIHEKYLQNTIKWVFKGIEFNVPQLVDEYLEFRYGKDWITPKQTVWYDRNLLYRTCFNVALLILDHIPDIWYYELILLYRKRYFKQFRTQCLNAGIPLPENLQLASMKARRHKRVLTVGVYDLIHKGHVELYRRAKGLGDYLIVAVQDSDSIHKYKPEATVMNSTEDRKYLIKSIRYVDEVISYTDVDTLVENVDFDVFVTGPDQCHNGFKRAISWCEEHGKEHVVLSRTVGISSSELKARIDGKTGRRQ